MPDLIALTARDGSFEAYLFGPAASSAYRDRDGIWTSPAPPISDGDLAALFERLSDAEAEALNVEAAHALTSPEPQQPRATPAQLLAAARDYRRRRDEASAMKQALTAIAKARQEASSTTPPGNSSALQASTAPQWGSKAWQAAFLEAMRKAQQEDPGNTGRIA